MRTQCEIESDSESDSESESPPLLPQAMPGESKSVRGIASASSVFGTAKPFRAKRPKAPGSWPHRRRPEGGEGRGWTGRGVKERGPSSCSRPHAHANRTSKIPIVPPHQRSGRRYARDGMHRYFQQAQHTVVPICTYPRNLLGNFAHGVHLHRHRNILVHDLLHGYLNVHNPFIRHRHLNSLLRGHGNLNDFFNLCEHPTTPHQHTNTFAIKTLNPTHKDVTSNSS
jgi:hypothetical protein